MPQEPHDIRYGVFYDIIGKAYTDAGEDAFNNSDLEVAMKFYDDMESKCDFIQLWDRREQKTLRQKGR